MPRVTRIDAATTGADVAAVERVLARRDGRISGIDGLLLHSPPLTHGWHAFFEALWDECTLDRSVQILALLRVGHLNRCAYQLMRHTEVARKRGLSEATIAAVGEGPDAAGLSTAQRDVLRYADAMTRGVQVPDATFDALRKHFEERHLVELTANIAAYNMVSRMMEALELKP